MTFIKIWMKNRSKPIEIEATEYNCRSITEAIIVKIDETQLIVPLSEISLFQASPTKSQDSDEQFADCIRETYSVQVDTKRK